MDVDLCLTCGRPTNEANEAYCSTRCLKLDRPHLTGSLPIVPSPRRRSFDVPSLSPSRHTPNHKSQARRAATRLCGSDSFPLPHLPSKARFRDDELQDGPGAFVAGRWTGKDREGILVWAHAVSPGLDECAHPNVHATSVTDLSVLAEFRFTRPPPFPLTAQNLAPPCVTVAPRHVLLNHTSMHSPSHHDDPTVPSLTQDDASLLTPATDSVITPSPPDVTRLPASRPLVGRFMNKLCSWIAAPSRTPRATPQGNPTAPSGSEGPAGESDDASCHYAHHLHSIGDKTDGTRSNAIRVANSSLHSANHSRPRVNALRSGGLYEYDDA